MSMNTLPLQSDIDWETLILEVQTDPAGPESEAFGNLYTAIYGYMSTIAKQWLERHRLSEVQDHALVALGLDKVLKEIGKFEIPDDEPTGIGLAFKGWVSTCCEREWTNNKNIHSKVALESHVLEEWEKNSCQSVEELLITEEEDTTSLSSRQQTISKQRHILNEELDRLPEAMRDAILETEDLKSIENPTGRGLKGETAAVASKYGLTPGAIRTARCRLAKRVEERFLKECS
ncbi:MAG: hypothetical protein KZQ95_15900 [Candidatus Thiodiazotropha sp. (ex Epidulcina cf. delphinae)]|nr:hypothetical protein [Candidatus Thiodiazotropha sp. (ex Epidulcina cf. delphinae)]